MDKDEKEVLSEMALNTLTTIGNNVRFIRRVLLGMNLNPMAEKTGVSRDVLCRLEALSEGTGAMGKGRVYPSLPTIIKFCESVGIDLSEMLTVDISMDANIQGRIIRDNGVSVENLKFLESLDD